MPLTAEQIKERIGYLGGSDAAAVIGLNRWRTQLQVWAEKTGEIEPPDLSDNKYVKMGNKLEPLVCDLFTEETGLKVRRVNETIYHPKYKFLAANIDRKLVGEDTILEVKTTSAYKSKEWDADEMPIEYIVQVMHYLAVTGYKKAYLAVLIGGNDFRYKEIQRDEKAIAELVKKEVDFWQNYVVPKVMPMQVSAADSDVLLGLFPTAETGTEVKLDNEVDSVIEQLESAKQDYNAANSLVNKLKNQLKAHIKENEIGVSPLYRITWKNVHKAEYVVPESNTRQLRYKRIG